MDKDFELKLKNNGDYDESDTLTMTPQQLAEMDGRTEDTPIYVALAGRIYDVSAKRESYGPGKNYACFVGRDASLHYATGCTDDVCPGDVNNLNEDEKRALNKWLEFYHNHDKYKYVGRLIPDPVETALERELGGDGSDVQQQHGEAASGIVHENQAETLSPVAQESQEEL